MKTRKVNIYNFNDKKPDVDRWICFSCNFNRDGWSAGLTFLSDDTHGLVIFDSRNNYHVCVDKWIGRWFYIDETELKKTKIKRKIPDFNRWICFYSKQNGGFWGAGLTASDVETGELVLYSQFDNFYFSYEDWIDDWFYLDEPQKENKKCKQKK